MSSIWGLSHCIFHDHNVLLIKFYKIDSHGGVGHDSWSWFGTELFTHDNNKLTESTFNSI